MSTYRTHRDLLAGTIPTGDIIKDQDGVILQTHDGAPSNGESGYAIGCICIDTTNGTLYRNTGSATSTTWTSLSAATLTLDGAFDNGKVIDGASSYANSFRVSDGTDGICIYRNAANDVRITTLSGDSADLTIAPDGGDTTITGTLTVSGATTVASLTVSGAASFGSISQDSIAASTADTALSVDGRGTGGVTLGATSTGNIALQRNVTIAASRTITQTGTGGSTVHTITAGDMVMSDGSLAITDADSAATLTITNNTATTTDGVFDFNATGVTTGTVISVDGTGVTEGYVAKLLATQATLTTGGYLQCYDGAAADFTVARYGATTIAGNAAGTDALTITNGDIGIAAGYIDLDNGKIEVDTTGDLGSYIKRNQTTTNSPVFEIEATHTGDDYPALLVDANQTGAVNGMTIDYDGSANALYIAPTAAAGSAIQAICAANTTDSIVKLDGATNDWIGANGVGLLNITCDGALAHANASCLLITYSGTGAATGLGTSLRIVDTGATATSYAAYISAATGEALYVQTGIAKFGESVSLDTGFTMTTSGFVVADGGAAEMTLDAGSANETFSIGKTTATDVLMHGTDANIDCLWDSSLDALNIGVATAVTRSVTSGKGVLNLFNASAAPAGTLANGITLYSEGGELKVMDAAGNSTTLSPHETLAGGAGQDWTFHSVDTKTGRVLHVEMEKLVKYLASKDPEVAKFITER